MVEATSEIGLQRAVTGDTSFSLPVSVSLSLVLRETSAHVMSSPVPCRSAEDLRPPAVAREEVKPVSTHASEHSISQPRLGLEMTVDPPDTLTGTSRKTVSQKLRPETVR